MSNIDSDYVILAGGCFWGVEELFRMREGVTGTLVGYTGGDLDSPTYNDVKLGTTGHAEAIKISFDKSKTTLADLLRFFYKMHDPTTLNRQGNDKGTQYRSVIFYKSEEQKQVAREIIKEVEGSKKFSRPITTSLETEKEFYPAEDYHQKYLEKNPNGYTCHFVRD